MAQPLNFERIFSDVYEVPCSDAKRLLLGLINPSKNNRWKAGIKNDASGNSTVGYDLRLDPRLKVTTFGKHDAKLARL